MYYPDFRTIPNYVKTLRLKIMGMKFEIISKADLSIKNTSCEDVWLCAKNKLHWNSVIRSKG